jgi:hypothetical protein
LTDEAEKKSSTLRKVLLEHYESRLESYIADLRQCLKRCFPSTALISQPQVVDSSLVSHLRRLKDAAFTEYDLTTIRNETLVLLAHSIYKSFSVEDFVEDFRSVSISSARNLRDSIGFLGRLQSSFLVLSRAAERLSSFESININIVDYPTCKNPPAKSGELSTGCWTVAETLEYLGYSLTDNQIQNLMGCLGSKTRWAKSKLLREFGKLKSSSWEVHAEMQLLPVYLQAMASDDLAVRYIGCSKNSCFLCYHFLDLIANITTRGCHGKLYHLWRLPDLKDATTMHAQRLAASVQGLENLIKLQLLDREARSLQPAKESTIGSSSIETAIPDIRQPSMSTKILEHLERQRANMRFSAENPG